MITVETLRAWGANVDEALERCLGNEAFYLRLTEKALQDPSFDRLKEAVASGDLEKGFEAAHALKGVYANLALTPLYTPTAELTELLRGGEMPKDNTLIDAIKKAYADLQALN